MFIDSHCHIHDVQFYPQDREAVYVRAVEAGVDMLLVGTSQADSREAAAFAATHPHTWAVVGVHPHDTKGGWADVGVLLSSSLASAPHFSEVLVSARESRDISRESRTAQPDRVRTPEKVMPQANSPKIVGIGEIGLDYFYDNSPRDVQLQALEQQLQWARDYDLPVSFHVREAFDDFWPVFDNFAGVRGVLHSFTDTAATLERALTRGLFIGVNGISTFTKSSQQQEMFRAIPLERMLLETDAPFLTPTPYRGKVNEPMYVRNVAEFHAAARGLDVSAIAEATTRNARVLYRLHD